MGRIDSLRTKDCELLLIAFFAGAFLATVNTGIIDRWIQRIPWGAKGCISLLLAVSAQGLDSIHALLTAPLSAFAFGAVAVSEGKLISSLGLPDGTQSLLLLILAVTLDFVLNAYSMDFAASLCRAFHTERFEKKKLFLSFIMLLTGLLASALLFCSALME